MVTDVKSGGTKPGTKPPRVHGTKPPRVHGETDDETDEVWKALADATRRAIVERLAGEQLCVCHLVNDLDLPQPLVSHHLRVLREAGLVEGERFRYWTYYRLRGDALRDLARGLAAMAVAAPTADARRRPCC